MIKQTDLHLDAKFSRINLQEDVLRKLPGFHHSKVEACRDFQDVSRSSSKEMLG